MTSKRSKKTKQPRQNDELINILLEKADALCCTKQTARFSSYGFRSFGLNNKWMAHPYQMYVYNGPLSVDELKRMSELSYDDILQSLKSNKRIQETIDHIFELTAKKLASYPTYQLKQIEQQQKTIQARKEAFKKQQERLKKEQAKNSQVAKTKGEAFFNSLSNEQRRLIKAMFKDG